MPRYGPTWARIGHDQALRANLTARRRPVIVYGGDARTRRHDRPRHWRTRARHAGADPRLRRCRIAVRDDPSPARTAEGCLTWDYGVRPRWCRLWVSAKVGRPLDPQDCGLGVSADQPGHIGGVMGVLTCSLSGRMHAVWSPDGPRTGAACMSYLVTSSPSVAVLAGAAVGFAAILGYCVGVVAAVAGATRYQRAEENWTAPG